MDNPTLADQFKARRKSDYADVLEFFELVEQVDPKSNMRKSDNRAVIEFSDGSTYTIGGRRP